MWKIWGFNGFKGGFSWMSLRGCGSGFVECGFESTALLSMLERQIRDVGGRWGA